jgi:oligopeptide transport system substrate-binding protein
LRLKLQRRAPYLPSILAQVSTAPLHRPLHAQVGGMTTSAGALVSNGAFTLGEVLTGSHVRLLRNPNFRENARNQIDVVKFLHLADENAELRAYRANELHITMVVPRGQFDWIRENLPKELHVAPQSNTYYYGFNLDRAPFADAPGLRRALSLVIDRGLLANKVLRVGELPAYGWIPPGLPGYSSQTFDYAGQPIEARIAEAQRLYRDAGYSPTRPLRFSLSYNGGEVHNKIAIAVASMWKAALGAEVALDAVEFRSLLDRINRRDVDVFRLSWRGDYNDPYTFLQALQSSAPTNSPHFRSADFDQLLEQALAASEALHRRQLFENAERVLLAQHPLIPLYFYVNKHLVKPTVRGWYNNPLDVLYSHDLSLSATANA